MQKHLRDLILADERHRRTLNRRLIHAFRVNERNKIGLQVHRQDKEYIPQVFEGVFSILSNREETLGYIHRVTGLLEEKQFTRLDLSAISSTDLPTVCWLGAYMLDYRTPARYLQVRIPQSAKGEITIWDESQFRDMILRDRIMDFHRGNFLSRSKNNVNEEAISEILDSTVNYFGTDKRKQLKNLSTIIVEIVENTVLHAKPGKPEKLPWIINTRDTIKDGVKEREFCIVDLGVGIYDSVKENVEKWNTKSAKLKHRLTAALYDSQTQCYFLSANIPKGIGSSSNENLRGYGVKWVYKMAQDDIYNNFVIITNRAAVDLKDIKNVAEDSTRNLNGTLYYWKVRV